LMTPCECDGRHGRFRICRTLFRFLGGVLIDLSLECAGFAREPAKVEAWVRFPARAPGQLTLEPDGQAAAWGTDAKRWSTAQSGFDSHRRLWPTNCRFGLPLPVKKPRSELTLRWTVTIQAQLTAGSTWRS